MQKRKSEENPDDGTQDGKQCIQHTRGGFGGFAGPIPDITPEKEEESGYDAARQQKILRNPEEIDLRKPDQRPMAEKRRQHDIRPLGESQHQRDGEDCDRAGHHGRGHHRKSTPQGQREERINERHTEQHQSKPGVSSRAPERIVSGRQVIDPDTTHDRPEQGQNIVMFARSAIDKIIYTRDPEIQCGHKNLHRHTHGTRRTQIKQKGQHRSDRNQQELYGPRGGVVCGDRIPKNSAKIY